MLYLWDSGENIVFILWANASRALHMKFWDHNHGFNYLPTLLSDAQSEVTTQNFVTSFSFTNFSTASVWGKIHYLLVTHESSQRKSGIGQIVITLLKVKSISMLAGSPLASIGSCRRHSYTTQSPRLSQENTSQKILGPVLFNLIFLPLYWSQRLATEVDVVVYHWPSNS